jgi:uncharacterized protein DUF397
MGFRTDSRNQARERRNVLEEQALSPAESVELISKIAGGAVTTNQGATMRVPNFSQAYWRKSSRSGGTGGACVEIALVVNAAGVRDSKLGEASPVLAFDRRTWTSFLMSIKAGELGR